MNIDNMILDQLYDTVVDSFNNREIPVAAAIFDSKDNKLISIAGNNRQESKNVLGHAEINAILEAESKIGDWRLDGYYMIATLEPCDMCSMIIKEARLDKVFYFLPGITNSKYDILTNKELITGYDEYKQKFNKLLTTFFDNMR